MQILLVERDTYLRAGFAFCLEAEGYRVLQASKITSSTLRERHVDLIVIDAGAQDESGGPAWESLAESTSSPILALALSQEEESRLRRSRHHRVAYLVKPFSLRLFVHTINDLCVRLQVA